MIRGGEGGGGGVKAQVHGLDRPFKPKYRIVSQIFLQLVVAICSRKLPVHVAFVFLNITRLLQNNRISRLEGWHLNNMVYLMEL